MGSLLVPEDSMEVKNGLLQSIEMANKKIGILTGGGDVPGLNSVIKGVTYRATEAGMEVLGFRLGWKGLTDLNLEDAESRKKYLLPLDRDNTRNIDRTGGTYLHSSRTNPARMRKVPEFLQGQSFPTEVVTKKGETYEATDISKHVIANLEKLGVDTLVAIGGDDTLSYAQKLHKQGFKVVSVPKTTTCATPSTASAFRRRSRGRTTRYSGSARRWVPTSGWACSASSGATRAIRRCTRRMSPPCAAGFRSSALTSTRWANC
jgi:hypothetical protein